MKWESARPRRAWRRCASAAAWASPCAWSVDLKEKLDLNKEELQALHGAGIIDATKLAEISAFMAARKSIPETTVPRFDLIHVLWYLGALIIIGAMGLFTNDAFNRMGGWALTSCGLAYAIVAGVVGHYLWTRKSLRIPGGLLIAVAVSMVPMIIYGIQDALDLWRFAKGDPGEYQNFFPYIHGSWVYMEVATVVVAGLAALFYRFPFILLIAAVALWFFSMDVAVWLLRNPLGSNGYDLDFNTRRLASVIVGLIVILASWAMDLKRRGGSDMAFWLHIAGAAAFWGGLTLSDGGTELQKFIYLLISIGLLGFSLFLNRKVYAVFGGMGVATYLGQLAFKTFKDMILFSFALSAIGLLIIFLGLMLHRNRGRLVASLDANLPDFLKSLRPRGA
jgi:hypothetical protein